MRLKGEKIEKSRVSVTLWDKHGKTTKDGKKSVTFTVEDTTMEELEKFLKEAIRKGS